MARRLGTLLTLAGLAVAAAAAACDAVLGVQQYGAGPHDGGDEPVAARSSSGGSGSSSGSDAGPVCVIGGKTYPTGAASPSSGCQSCQPDVSTTTFSSSSDGTTCGSGGICHAGTCVSGCEIGNVYFTTNAPNPNDPCQSCQPATSATMWSMVADGTGCGNGQVCASGQCGTQCDILGAVVPSGSANPMNACQTCQPGTSTTGWTDLVNGTSCPGPGTCSSGSCVMSCTGGIMEMWQGPPQPAWDFDEATAGTYICSATLPAGVTPSGQSVMLQASGGTTAGNALYTCSAGTWVLSSGASCDGSFVPTMMGQCMSTDPVTTMFIGFYASDLYRCADTNGLAYWVGSYNDAGGACNGSPGTPACWENSFIGGTPPTATEYLQAQALGHIADSGILCVPNAGYPWSDSGSYVLSNGTQCKYYP